jgi:hypothetical protein
MKLNVGALSMYHIADGRHRETVRWHDADHKAEVIATVPGIFVSQRWVTPPGWLGLRPASPLEHGGGEYVNLYWSSGSDAELTRDFADLGARMSAAGRMRPADEYMEKIWPVHSRSRIYLASVQGRPGLPTSAEAAMVATSNTALMTVIDSVDDSEADAYGEWQRDEYIPMVLRTGIFTAAALCTLAPGSSRDDGQFVTLYYLDSDTPEAGYRQFQEIRSGWSAAGRLGPHAAESSHRQILESLAVPSIGNYSFYA